MVPDFLQEGWEIIPLGSPYFVFLNTHLLCKLVALCENGFSMDVIKACCRSNSVSHAVGFLSLSLVACPNSWGKIAMLF